MLRTFFYPLAGTGLWVVSVCSLALSAALWLVVVISAEQPYAGYMSVMFLLPVFLGFTGILARYGLVTLLRTARGYDTPPSIDLPDLNPMRWPHVLLLVLLAVVLGLAIAGIENATARFLVAGVVVVLGAPVITVAALNESLIIALQPAQIVRLIRGLGIEGLGLVAVGVAWGGLVAALSQASGLAGFAATAYLFVLAHHLAGRLVFRHRLGLDLETEVSPEQANAALSASRHEEFRTLMVELHRMCSVDQVTEAYAVLEGYLAREDSLDETAVYLSLQDFHDRRLRLEHSFHYIERLSLNRDRVRAWQVLLDAVAQDASFRAPSDELLISLLSEAQPEHAASVALMLKDFEQRYPQSHLTANALFRLAVVKIDYLDAQAEGKALLQRVADEFPEFAGQQRFVNYLSRLPG